jgi:uncharacterized protein YacL
MKSNVWLWIYRSLLLIGAPLLVYFQISHTPRGLAIGAGVAAGVIAIEIVASSISLLNIITAFLGATVAIILARLLDTFVYQVGTSAVVRFWSEYAVLRYFAFGILGLVLALRKSPEFEELDKDILKLGKRRGSTLKILDTSAIIDGRIADICETKFLSGSFIVPRFILDELHHLADSPDNFKRARGRRGLDILAKLQENQDIPLKIIEKNVPEIPDTDGKLVRLAKEMGARLVTTDFNLNKLASLDGVVCLNINDLGAALKPIVLPGETMSLFVMKDGKEREQGVGYLDDGTMVVVEDGKKHIGKRIEISVTSILQTSAGRMIFGKPKPEKAAVA